MHSDMDKQMPIFQGMTLGKKKEKKWLCSAKFFDAPFVVI